MGHFHCVGLAKTYGYCMETVLERFGFEIGHTHSSHSSAYRVESLKLRSCLTLEIELLLVRFTQIGDVGKQTRPGSHQAELELVAYSTNPKLSCDLSQGV